MVAMTSLQNGVYFMGHALVVVHDNMGESLAEYFEWHFQAPGEV
jgi:hypothetical protein